MERHCTKQTKLHLGSNITIMNLKSVGGLSDRVLGAVCTNGGVSCLFPSLPGQLFVSMCWYICCWAPSLYPVMFYQFPASAVTIISPAHHQHHQQSTVRHPCSKQISNMPYAQSSAKLPVTQLLGHLVTWSLSHSVTMIGHLVTD